MLANPIVRTATLAGACCMGVLVGLTIFVPLYFETVIHLSASQSGLALIPLMGASVISATLTGRSMAQVEHYKRMAFAGFVVAILGLGALAIWPVGLPMAGMIAILTVIGFGIGAVFPVTTVAMQNAVSDRHMGIATGSLNFFRSLTAALMVALLGAIVLGGIGGQRRRLGRGAGAHRVGAGARLCVPLRVSDRDAAAVLRARVPDRHGRKAAARSGQGSAAHRRAVGAGAGPQRPEVAQTEL